MLEAQLDEGFSLEITYSVGDNEKEKAPSAVDADSAAELKAYTDKRLGIK